MGHFRVDRSGGKAHTGPTRDLRLHDHLLARRLWSPRRRGSSADCCCGGGPLHAPPCVRSRSDHAGSACATQSHRQNRPDKPGKKRRRVRVRGLSFYQISSRCVRSASWWHRRHYGGGSRAACQPQGVAGAGAVPRGGRGGAFSGRQMPAMVLGPYHVRVGWEGGSKWESDGRRETSQLLTASRGGVFPPLVVPPPITADAPARPCLARERAPGAVTTAPARPVLRLPRPLVAQRGPPCAGARRSRGCVPTFLSSTIPGHMSRLSRCHLVHGAFREARQHPHRILIRRDAPFHSLS